MGKATRWLRSLITSKKSPDSAPPPKQRTTKTKWAFTNSSGTSIKFRHNVQDPLASPYAEGLDANKHAIAVAAATAAVAEAALAAAQAAAEVVRLTSNGASGRNSADRRPVVAAIKIQSAFRAYLARRALRALKGLVKLQALVRGHIVRKQSANMLRRMQAMARIQARASAHRCYTTEYCNGRTIFTNSYRPGNTNTGKCEVRLNNVKLGGSLLKQNHLRSPMGNSGSSQIASKWLNHWMDDFTLNSLTDTCPADRLVDDERSDKILEIDTWKPRQNNSRNAKAAPISHYFSAWNNRNQNHSKSHPSSRLPNPSISSEEVSSVISSKIPHEGDHGATWTAGNSPRLHSAPSQPANNVRGAFSPARSECSRSFFGDYIGHPGYMANTESSRAKARSLSAPKQRVLVEETGWGAKFGQGLWESDALSEKGSGYNSRVKRQGGGTPSRDPGSGFGNLYGHRH